LVDHNDWSRWFAISSPHTYAVPVTILLVGLPKNKRAKLKPFNFIIQRDVLSTGMEMLLLIKKEKRRVPVRKVEAGTSKVQRRYRLRVRWGTRYTFRGS
jgi:hypothetical protein